MESDRDTDHKSHIIPRTTRSNSGLTICLYRQQYRKLIWSDITRLSDDPAERSGDDQKDGRACNEMNPLSGSPCHRESESNKDEPDQVKEELELESPTFTCENLIYDGIRVASEV